MPYLRRILSPFHFAFMRMSTASAWSLAACVVALATGCEQAREAKNTYNAVVTTTKAAEQMATNLESAQARQAERAKRGDTLAINYKELQQYLPSGPVAGYAAEGKPEGQTVQMTGAHYSTASQDYKNAEQTLSVTLMDYNGAAAMFTAATAMMNVGMSIENDEQVMRGVDLGIPNVKAFETLDKKDRKASLVLGVADRFFVSVEATGQDNTELVQEVAKKIDLTKLAKL